MLFSIFLFLFTLILPILVAPLQCYSCTDPIVVNNSVTSETIPSFSQCQLVIGIQCMIYIHWDLDKNTTSIAVSAIDSITQNNVLDDTIMPMAFMNIGTNKNDLLSGHSLLYFCMLSNKCNNNTNLKKILSSLVIEDQFRQELSPLLQVVPSFDPKTAACFDFNNSTNQCSPKDLNHCPRCQTTFNTTNSSSTEMCATCPIDPVNANTILHSVTFSLSNQTKISEYVRLDCQLKGCNSIENVNRVYNTSIITFDFHEYFKNLSDLSF